MELSNAVLATAVLTILFLRPSPVLAIVSTMHNIQHINDAGIPLDPSESDSDGVGRCGHHLPQPTPQLRQRTRENGSLPGTRSSHVVHEHFSSKWAYGIVVRSVRPNVALSHQVKKHVCTLLQGIPCYEMGSSDPAVRIPS